MNRWPAVAMVAILATACTPSPAPVNETTGRDQASRGPVTPPRRAADPTRRGDTRAGPADTAASAGSRRSGRLRSAAPEVARVGRVTPYPRPGTYVYAQEGFEELCRAGACDRQALPDDQEIEAVVVSESPARTVVQTTARSGSRELRTTTSYGRPAALITELAFHFDYRGLRLSRSYRPAPAVAALRLPFAEGRRWAGRWTAETSGSYRVVVVGRATLTSGGSSVEAWHLHTLTAFRGELRGTADIDTWIDASDLGVVAMRGTMDIASAFGNYRSRFSSHLVERPPA